MNRCEAQNRYGRQCPLDGVIRDAGALVCTHHNRHGWLPFFIAPEPEDREMALRAARVIAAEFRS